jgi:hypothetical protein
MAYLVGKPGKLWKRCPTNETSFLHAAQSSPAKPAKIAKVAQRAIRPLAILADKLSPNPLHLLVLHDGLSNDNSLGGVVMTRAYTRDLFTIELPRPTKGIDKELVEVDPLSPLAHLRIVEQFGYFFKREFRYDIPPFEAGVSGQRNWIFASQRPDPDWRAFGACGFERKFLDESHPFWLLEWIWLHPYFRRQGSLKKAWPVFLAELGGPFEVQPPLSKAMLGFLRTVDTDSWDTSLGTDFRGWMLW